MNILTWNIQATKGCDDVFSSERIVSQIKAFSDLDVICLQEVARNIPTLNAEDQPTIFSNVFSDFIPTWAPGFSVPDASGNRSEFGNLTLVRAPLFKNARTHVLPSPRIEGLQIPRTMAEVVIKATDMDVAIFNAHLAFHSRTERIAQLQDLTRLRNQIIEKSATTTIATAAGPFMYADDIKAVLLCGDLNVDSDSIEFKENIVDEQWEDCWHKQDSISTTILQEPRQPTCGCFDRKQWPEGPHVRDYFLATKNIAAKTTSVTVDVNTDASDHQPVLLEMAL